MQQIKINALPRNVFSWLLFHLLLNIPSCHFLLKRHEITRRLHKMRRLSVLRISHICIWYHAESCLFFALKPQNWLRPSQYLTKTNCHQLTRASRNKQRVPQKKESVKSSEQPQICTNNWQVSTRIKHVCVKGSVQAIYRKK